MGELVEDGPAEDESAGHGAAEEATPVRVLVVDDDALVRAGLSMMLGAAADIVVVGEVADGADVADALDRHAPDVVLMDIRMPRMDGITATATARGRARPPQVLVLTTFDADEHVAAALRAGAAGFLLKDTPPSWLIDAVRQVAAGEPILSPDVVRRLMAHFATGGAAADRARFALGRLSGREREVALAVARGSSNAQIAAALFMSVATVKAHVSSVLTKLALSNRTQIAVLAHDAGAL